MADDAFVPLWARVLFESILDSFILENAGIDVSGCEAVKYFTRYVTADGQSYAYFQGAGQTDVKIDEAHFNDEAQGSVFALPALPEGLGSYGYWLGAYQGTYSQDRNSAILLYAGIVGAHHRNVLRRGSQCAYDEDTLQSFNSIDENICLPSEQRNYFSNLLSNGRLEPLFMRQAREDAEAIVAVDGCRGPRARIIRENLFLLLNGRNQLSRDQLQEWASDL